MYWAGRTRQCLLSTRAGSQHAQINLEAILMTNEVSMDTSVTLGQAFMIMHTYLEQHWESVGRPDAIGALLGEISLWDTESGGKEPMDGAVFPAWLQCAGRVLKAEETPEGFRGADVLLDGKPPNIKVNR
jgi:hypothetical protein